MAKHFNITGASSVAKVTITDYTELNAGDIVNLIATDGAVPLGYDFEQGSQSSVDGTFEATTSNAVTATNLMNVINTSSGPSGTRFSATVSGTVITITQNTMGADGNTTVTLTDSGTAGMALTSSFTGGIDVELTRELLAVGDNVKVSSISLTNIHASTKCTVDLYIEKQLTGKFYLLKKVELPVGVTLFHDIKGFNNKAGGFGLYVKLTKSDVFTLTGTIDPAASATVPGVNTLFLTEVVIGDEIIVSAETRTVSAIASNTSLTVSAATTNTANDTTPDCSPKSRIDVILS